MKLFGRQDALLLGGLTVAVLIVFSGPLARLLDFAYQVERQSGLTLIPALVVLTVVFALHQMRKRHEVQEQAAAAEAACMLGRTTRRVEARPVGVSPSPTMHAGIPGGRGRS